MIVAICVISRECEEYHMCRWDNPDESACVLHRFCVSPDHQNRGIGSLVLSLIREALSMGVYVCETGRFPEPLCA